MARGRSQGRDRVRKSYEWNTMGDVLNAVAIPAKNLGVNSLQAGVPQTIVRLRGTVGATLDAGGVDESLIVRFGIRIVSSDAAAIGATAIPGPGSDRSEDWMWTGQLYLTSGDEAAIVTDMLSGSLVIDGKAMRKFQTGEVLVFMQEVLAAEYTDQGGALNTVYVIDNLTQTV